MDTACVEWTGAKTRGYGQLTIGNKHFMAHRLAFETAYGPIPPKLYVCHTCDNPLCIKVTHLFLGTQSDNMRDMRTKNRQYHPPTICKLGHAVDGITIRTHSIIRYCKTCNRASCKRYRANHKAKELS